MTFAQNSSTCLGVKIKLVKGKILILQVNLGYNSEKQTDFQLGLRVISLYARKTFIIDRPIELVLAHYQAS